MWGASRGAPERGCPACLTPHRRSSDPFHRSITTRQRRVRALTVLSHRVAMITSIRSVLNFRRTNTEPTMSIFNRFLKDDSGATAIEYGLIAALVAAAAITAMTTLGTNLIGTFTKVSDKLQ